MKNSSNSAFSLLELAIVLTIIGVVVTLSVSGLQSQLDSSEIASTKQRLDTIKLAIENYRTQFEKYPCPALPNLASSDPSYGDSVPDCYTTCPAGLNCVANSTNGALLDMAQGSIPFKTLGIAPELTIDSWGNKITYAIDARFTQDLNRCETDGLINIQDYSNNSVTSKAMYALVSHGIDKKGAYSPESGTITMACDGSAKDGANCDNNTTFRISDISTSNTNTAYYDDVMLFSSNAKALYCPAGLSGCQIWYDASDKCSIITNTGGVHSIRNKASLTGLYPATQTTSGNRPDYSTTRINNRNFITFNPANIDALYASVTGILSDGPYSIVTVFASPASASTTTFNVLADSASFSATTFDRSHGLTTGFFRSYNHTAGGAQFITSTGTFNNGFPRIAVTTVGAGGSKSFVDGVSIGTQLGTASSRTAETTLIIGSHTNLGAANYNLLEYLYFNKELTDDERKTLQVYLAQKWGLNY